MMQEKDPLWFKDAIFYELRVRSFFDAKGNGIGDFKGLAEKLDYIKDLGITTIWILPFYESPMKDDGYDISDYTQIHPDYGSLQDFKFFLKEAHKRDLKVLTELVINHTSSMHPWFQRARKSKPKSRWRNFYVWSDTPERYKDARIIFKDFEISNWTWDPIAQAYYWHRFYSHQPDLNFENPDVKKAIFQVVDFWFDMGIDGFRLDAIPYLFEREGTNCENLPETHQFLKELKQYVSANYEGRMLLAEANQWPEDAASYFGNGDECDMAFHFPIMPRIFMALRMEDSFPLIDILQQTPQIPPQCQWAIFLRNHDELTLEMVTDEERDYMYKYYANDPQARINLGIRRRLAPLLDNDRRKIELMNSLLLSLPGTPVIYYGDEIGMGDNFYLGDRNGVRTPMQWSSDRNAGFSKANPQRLYLPVIVDPEYHYNTINVENQLNNSNSLLSWMKRLISLRKKFKAFGRGSITFLQPGNRKVLVFFREYEEELVLVVVNFSRFVQYVELDLSMHQGMKMIELFGGTEFPKIKKEPYMLTLGRHAFYWFALVSSEEEHNKSISSRLNIPQLETFQEWTKLIQEKSFWQTILPDYFRTCHWFSGKAKQMKSFDLIDSTIVFGLDKSFCIQFLKVEYLEEGLDIYMLPMAFKSGEDAKSLLKDQPEAVIAKLQVNGTKGVSDGVIYDALFDKEFYTALLETIFKRKTIKTHLGSIESVAVNGIRRGSGIAEASLEHIKVYTGRKNGVAVFEEKMILKVYRKLEDGVVPELEIGNFLTNHSLHHSFASIRAALRYQKSEETEMTFGILQGFIPNQGTALKFVIEELEKFFEEIINLEQPAPEIYQKNKTILDLAFEEPSSQIKNLMSQTLEAARMIGYRTAEFHHALGSDSTDPKFAPETFTLLYQRSIYQTMRTALLCTFDALSKRLQDIPQEFRNLATLVIEQKEKILKIYQEVIFEKIDVLRIRIHGNYSLKQLLYTGKDFVSIDFEGSCHRPVNERKFKRSSLRDIASMICDFSYTSRNALKKYLKRGVDSTEAISRLQHWAYVWQRWTSCQFLKSYIENSSQANYLPKKNSEIELLLKIYLFDRAILLLDLELSQNLASVDIPLEILMNLLEFYKKE